MADKPVTIRFLYPEGETEFVEASIRTLVDLGCRADSEGGTGDWRVSVDSNRSHLDSIDAVIETLRTADEGRAEVWAKTMPIKVDINLESSLTPTDFEYVGLSVSNLYFDPDFPSDGEGTAATYLSRFLHLVNTVFRRTDPVHGYGFYEREGMEAYVPTSEQIYEGVIDHPCWANYFTRRMIDRLGRECLLSAPAARTEQLHEEGILLVVTKYPFEFGPDNNNLQAVVDHLGLSIPDRG